jgi:hypothetical protein
MRNEQSFLLQQQRKSLIKNSNRYKIRKLMSIGTRLFSWCLSAEAWALRVVAHRVEAIPKRMENLLKSRINLHAFMETDLWALLTRAL